MPSVSYEMAIRRAVVARRKELGLTQTAVAARCGVRVQAINRFERGSRGIGVFLLRMWAEALEMRVYELLRRVEEIYDQ